MSDYPVQNLLNNMVCINTTEGFHCSRRIGGLIVSPILSLNMISIEFFVS